MAIIDNEPVCVTSLGIVLLSYVPAKFEGRAMEEDDWLHRLLVDAIIEVALLTCVVFVFTVGCCGCFCCRCAGGRAMPYAKHLVVVAILLLHVAVFWDFVTFANEGRPHGL